MSQYAQGPVLALLATLGFCLLYRTPPGEIPFAALGGALSWGAAIALEALTRSKVLSFFAASVAVGLYAEILAAFRKQPPSVYIYAAIIPLVPGGGMYYTMFEAVNGRGPAALDIGFETISLAGAIASGLAIAASSARIASLAKPRASGMKRGKSRKKA